MTNHGPPRVLVMGGSLGGLTAALVLRDGGCEVEVFERSSAALDSRGAGIVSHDMTVKYFVEHARLDLDEVSTTARWLRYLARDGTILHKEPCRYRFTSWNTLHKTLLECFGTDHYHLGAEVVDFKEVDGEVVVRLADGREHTCDLLVCADGISSTARSLLLPETVPRYAGYVGWRGTINESELAGELNIEACESIIYHVYPHSHILSYPIPSPEGSVESGSRLINFVWYRNVPEGEPFDRLMTDRDGERRALSVPPGGVEQEFVDELRTTAEARLPEPLRTVVVEAPEPFLQAIFDVRSPQMAFGHIALMGDAAFTARPHAAAGTAKAAADAWALAEAVSDPGGDTRAALIAWERSQLPLGQRLTQRTQDMGRRSQFDCTWTPGDPALAFGLYGPGN